MYLAYKKKMSVYILIGATLLGTARFIIGCNLAGVLLFLAGYVFFVIGCINFAKAKNYKTVIGLLLGFLNLVGLVVLVLLMDKSSSMRNA